MFATKADDPTAVLFEAVVFEPKELSPTAVFVAPVVLAVNDP